MALGGDGAEDGDAGLGEEFPSPLLVNNRTVLPSWLWRANPLRRCTLTPTLSRSAAGPTTAMHQKRHPQ